MEEKRQKKLEIIALLKARIRVITTYQDSMTITSWHDHEGVLITGMDAEFIIRCLEKDIDDHVRETGAMPVLGWIIDKIRAWRSCKKKYPDLDKYAKLEREYS